MQGGAAVHAEGCKLASTSCGTAHGRLNLLSTFSWVVLCCALSCDENAGLAD